MEAPTAWGLLLQVAALLVVYDALFFVGHWTMHRLPWLYKHVHALHHDQAGLLHACINHMHALTTCMAPVTRAYDTLRLSYPEQLIDVACSVVAVNLLRAHPLARVIYNVVIVYLLVELHSG